MDKDIIKALTQMFEYWSQGISCNGDELNILQSNISKLYLYQKHLEGIEFYLMEGMSVPKNITSSDIARMVNLTKTPFSKRSDTDRLEVLHLFTKHTQNLLKIESRVSKEEITRYSQLAQILPQNRTISENEELNSLANKILESRKDQ